MQHLLSLFDIDRQELDALFYLADELRLSDAYKPLAGVEAALIFQKPSLRTRVSFEVGIRQLGGNVVHLVDEGIGLGKRESVYDVANVLSRFVGLIVARVFDHSLLEELALHASVPVVNALSDLSHPCQILSDVYTMRQFGKLSPGVRVAFIGDGNNVVNSWLEMAALYPIDFVVACPEGHDPDAAILARAESVCEGSISIVRDPWLAAANADVVYGDTWISMGQEGGGGANGDPVAIAGQTSKNVADFEGYQITERLFATASPDALFMHCLPAHRGQEVTARVIDGDRSVIFDQAENRLHMQKALLARLIDSARTVAGVEHVTLESTHRLPSL